MNMNFETMGKTELRAACKQTGISYGKMTVAGMRAALGEAYAEGEGMEAMEQERDEAQNPEVQAEAPVATVKSKGKQAKAEKAEKPVREMRNGVKRPGPGLCRDVWDYLDKTGNAMPADLKDVAAQKGWNFGNVTIELYQWRKFNGLKRPEKA